MDINYDKEADALYIRLMRGTVARTVEVSDRCVIDLDAQGGTLGIEVLQVSAHGNLAETLEQQDTVPVTVHEGALMTYPR